MLSPRISKNVRFGFISLPIICFRNLQLYTAKINNKRLWRLAAHLSSVPSCLCASVLKTNPPQPRRGSLTPLCTKSLGKLSRSLQRSVSEALCCPSEFIKEISRSPRQNQSVAIRGNPWLKTTPPQSRRSCLSCLKLTLLKVKLRWGGGFDIIFTENSVEEER